MKIIKNIKNNLKNQKIIFIKYLNIKIFYKNIIKQNILN